MNIILYLFYCVTTLFSTVYGGDTEGSTVERVIGLLCVLVFAVLIVGIISLSNFIAKKIRKKKTGNITKKDFINNNDKK